MRKRTVSTNLHAGKIIVEIVSMQDRSSPTESNALYSSTVTAPAPQPAYFFLGNLLSDGLPPVLIENIEILLSFKKKQLNTVLIELWC